MPIFSISIQPKTPKKETHLCSPNQEEKFPAKDVSMVSSRSIQKLALQPTPKKQKERERKREGEAAPNHLMFAPPHQQPLLKQQPLTHQISLTSPIQFQSIKEHIFMKFVSCPI